MKIILRLVIITLGALTLWSISVQAEVPKPEDFEKLRDFNLPANVAFVPGEIIVKMKPSKNLESAELSRLGIQPIGQMTSGREIIYQILLATLRALSPAQARDLTLAIIRELNARPDVEYAHPNYIERPFATTPNDPLFPYQWHYRNNGTGTGESPGGISLPRAWDTSTGSSSVVVAVLDTGILSTHNDITGSPNLVPGFDMVSSTFMSNDGDGRDSDPTDPGDAVAANECVPLGSPPHPAQPDSWHGTLVAGIVGVGRTNNGIGVAGVNWTVSVQPVRVLGKCGGTTADINDAIRWAAGLPVPGVPTNATPARVINMGFGTRPGVPCSLSPSRQAAINAAVAAGAAVVVAAGNDAVDASQVSPASCNNVITVAASDYRGHLVTRYSNFGTIVEIMGPGGDLNRDDDGDGNPDGVLSMVRSDSRLSSFPGSYAYYDGTSMAAAHVAGVAALVLAQDSTLTPVQLLTELQNNALLRTASQCPQPCGAGLMHALRGQGLAVPPGLQALAAVDRILQDLALGNIAFNAPSTLPLGESAMIQLLLSVQRSVEELKRMIAQAGEIEGARIRISDQMEARLSGLGFKIEAITPEVQAVSEVRDTEWKWEIEPSEPGPQRLHLTLSALLRFDGQRIPRVIRTFERTINVRVTWYQRLSGFVGANWQWLWTAILIPIVGWIIRKRRKQKRADRTEPEI